MNGADESYTKNIQFIDVLETLKIMIEDFEAINSEDFSSEELADLCEEYKLNFETLASKIKFIFDNKIPKDKRAKIEELKLRLFTKIDSLSFKSERKVCDN